jgi:hypothetical protein
MWMLRVVNEEVSDISNKEVQTAYISDALDLE